MRAIVFALGHAPGISALTDSRSAEMLPLVDRPFLQHVLEALVDAGVHRFDFVLHHHPDRVEAHFGDGKRWGSEIRYHLVRDGAAPYQAVQAMEQDEGIVAIVRGDCLPLLPAGSFGAPAMFLFAGEWTGWTVAPGGVLENLAGARSEEEARDILSAAAPARIPCELQLSVSDYDRYLESHSAVMEQRFPLALLTGTQAGERIWISRNVSIHPSVKLSAPVFIGENCRIAEGVALGPGVVIGANSVIDRKSSLRDTVIFPGSYVGEALDLERSIVDQSKLVNVALGAALGLGDDFLLGSMAPRLTRSRFGRPLERVLALGLLTVFFPVLALTMIWVALRRFASPFVSRALIRLPAPADSDRWRATQLTVLAGGRSVGSPRAHFLLRFLPGLPAVVLGRVGLVGVEPRTPEEVAGLHSDWRALYLNGYPGLVTEAFVQYGDQATPDEHFACEAFYSAAPGIALDLSILRRYAARVLGLRRAERARAAKAGQPE